MNYDKPENGGLESPPASDNIFEKMFIEPVKLAPVDIPQSNVYSDLAKLSTKKRRFLQQKSQK